MFSLVSFGNCVFKGLCFILAIEFFDIMVTLIAPCFVFNISRIFSDGHLSFLILVICIFSLLLLSNLPRLMNFILFFKSAIFRFIDFLYFSI